MGTYIQSDAATHNLKQSRVYIKNDINIPIKFDQMKLRSVKLLLIYKILFIKKTFQKFVSLYENSGRNRKCCSDRIVDFNYGPNFPR